MLPHRSAAATYTVSPAPVVSTFGAPVLDARCGFTLPQSEAACALDVRVSSGTGTTFGSALRPYTSAYTVFFVSINACQYNGLAGPSDASVWPGYQSGTHCSRTFIDSTIPHACDGAVVP